MLKYLHLLYEISVSIKIIGLTTDIGEKGWIDTIPRFRITTGAENIRINALERGGTRKQKNQAM